MNLPTTRLLESDGSFEIRQYPDLMMATTTMEFASQGSDGSFMRLFRYISGENDAQQKVAMTTPVLMQTEAGATPGRMGFVIPEKDRRAEHPRASGRPGRDSPAVRWPIRSHAVLLDG